MKAKDLLIPFTLLVYFFIHFATDLFYFLHFKEVVFSFFKYIVVCFVVFGLGYNFSKNKNRFVLFFSTLLFSFLFFGSFLDTAAGLNIPVANKTPGILSIILFVVFIIAIYWVCYKLNNLTIQKLIRFWLIYSLALIIYDLVAFVAMEKSEKKYLQNNQNKILVQSSTKLPVFFLLFDMYPSDSVLKNYLNYDNSSISNFLRNKNFFVAGNSTSLFSETYFSLSSTLNLQPLEYIKDSSLKDYKKILLALANIENASMPAAFINAGYNFRNFSVFKINNQNSPLQFNLTYHSTNALTASTFYNRLYNSFETDFFQHSHGINLSFLKPSWSENEKIDIAFLKKKFNEVLDSFPEQRPSFNYFHFMIPHPPILYDSAGRGVALKDRYAFGGFHQSNKNFTNYIQFANKLIEEMVNDIFEKVGKNAVIIIQGDHGYREFKTMFPDKVRLGAMNAIYLPGSNYNSFTDSMNVLQTFKQLLHNEFEMRYTE